MPDREDSGREDSGRDDDAVLLEVPEVVQALYIVPAIDPPEDPATYLHGLTADRWAGTLREMLANLLAGSMVPIEVRPVAGMIAQAGSSRPAPRGDPAQATPLPIDLLAAMGASEEQLRRVETATHYVVAVLQSQSGWPPVHEWMARALAVVIAERLDSDIVDVMNYQIIDVETANRTLPDARDRIRLADWVWIENSANSTGYWCTTNGLRRFGLPELQTLATPPHVVGLWGQTMTGLASRVLGAWSERLADDRHIAFVELPGLVEVTRDDVAIAYGERPDGGGGSATVRLALDPGANPAQHSFLTIHPPLSWAGSAGEYIANACVALYGPRGGGIRHAAPSQRMDRAIATARAGLGGIRDRFDSGQLTPQEKLLVKFAVTAEGGTEYLWAYVTSWRDPERVLATSAADALYDPQVRAGRPVVVDTGRIIDWAVEHDELGIVEGGWTQEALD